ncbi:GNAT family N-acetyltransferase [Streptomyces sp. NPDC046324]|uniref:GNAT family N-acetyltransferase n=1 Tax=Streptomyces sp. NPDC046324 TaxID=3154915 RepID=UPI0033D9EC82
MSFDTDRVAGYADILATVGDTPYTRMALSPQSTAYVTDRTVAWLTRTPWASLVSLNANSEAAAELFMELRRSGRIPDGSWLRVPLPARRFHGLPGVRLREEWQFRWTTSEPPVHTREAEVALISTAHYDALEELLRVGNPDTVVRARARGIHGWYGIWEGGQLVACGADRSFGGVGYLAAITVRPGRRREGLGTALTAAMTRRLIAGTGAVGLGVNTGNHGAIDLYKRLGFHEAVEVATFEVSDGGGHGHSWSAG